MGTKVFHTILILLIFTVSGMAQNAAKYAKKADKHYQLRQYALAIPFYKQALEGKNSTAWLYKLGNCYRLTNKTEKAQEVFGQLMESGKKIKTKAYLHYSEVLISNGNYDTAKKMLESYLAIEDEDEEARLILSNLDQIKNIQPFYANVDINAFSHNTDADDHGAVFLDDGIVFVSDRKRGATLFKENAGTTGRDFLSLYFAPREGKMDYGKPSILPRKINALNKNTGPASFTQDGKTIVFSQNDHSPNRKGELSLQLFSAKRVDGKWKDVKKLKFCNSNTNYMHPAISADGKMLFFSSNKGKGEGGMDLYFTTLRSDGSWSRPENLGPTVNTSAHEGFPYFGLDEKLYFCSKGHVGFGGFDIFCTKMDEFGNWSTPINLGNPINSSQDDITFCMNETGKFGLFTSSRNGGDDDIFIFRFKEENDMVMSVQLKNTDGLIMVADAQLTAVPLDSTKASQDINIVSDRAEISLEPNTTYDITITKEGYVPYSERIEPGMAVENFLKLEAILIKNFK